MASATFRITDFHLAGEIIHVGGKITKKWQENGLNLVERLPIVIEPNEYNERYLRTKALKLGHRFDDGPID